MNRSSVVGFFFLAAVSTSCSDGGGPSGQSAYGGEFLALRTTPVDNGMVFLNDPILIDFSAPIDLDSASLDTVSFHVFDHFGTPVSESVVGLFHIGSSIGDHAPGRQLLFVPHLPTDNHFSNGGLRSDREYIVHLVGGVAQNGTTVRSVAGAPLGAPMSFRFSTTRGTSPAQLFRNPRTGGPRRLTVGGMLVATATDLDDVPLNLFGAPPVEVRLNFDQALNPHDANVPVHFDSNPLVRSIGNRGRLFLEYDDPVSGNNTWIPTDVELERNDIYAATVVLRPVGVLPNNAAIRVIVENTVEDISGESNIADLAYDRVFGTFQTARAYEQQWNGVAENFISAANIDLGAVFAEPLAEVEHGFVKASFAFEGNNTTFDFQPILSEVVLNTVFTQVVPHGGLPFNVSGGVFNFRNVFIQQGVVVRGQGRNPMVWLCGGDFRVAGELSVQGGDGERVVAVTAAHWPKAGGISNCGGGAGGPGSPSALLRDLRGGAGYGPMQVPATGGAGGRLACAGCFTGSGGGGGTLATQGDPSYRAPATTGTSFQQRRGIGGAGCYGASGQRSPVLLGGEAAPLVFTDSRADNDFWGAGVNLGSNLRVTGELLVPIGGGGGGGGGDQSSTSGCVANDPSFSWDGSGAGGGGGGGVLIVKALGEIEVTSTGRITADGGHGGGGEFLGACSQGGGGGGGAGGMVVLMSAKRIVLHTHGTATRWTYAQSDYDFVVSADGGICSTPGALAENKYPPGGQAMTVGPTYDAVPRGGLGGMGIVQLMAPPGDNLTDGTNTRLDDNILVYRGAALQNGAAKKEILAWRGFQNAAGVFVDDAGVPTNIGQNEGDIRPAPVLLPSPFSARSRLRSKWIDTGMSKRRPLLAADGLPRGLVLDGSSVTGPVHEFVGLQTSGATAGFLAYQPIGSAGVQITQPIAVPAIGVLATNAAADHLGSPAYAIELSQPLGPQSDRHRQYEAELLDASGALVGSFRIVSHTDTRVLLAPDGAALPQAVAQLRVRAKFFRIVTNGIEGLGPAHVPLGGLMPVPHANVRIGFAFHRDPAAGPAGRFPLEPQTFVHDLADPALLLWLQQNGAPRYAQWDVLFDMTFSGTPSLEATSPRPELHFLRLPFRF